MALPGEIDNTHCLEESCGKPLELSVCRSFAGYFIGTECDEHGPNSRESGYFLGHVEAEKVLAEWNHGNTVGKRDTDFHPGEMKVVEITADMSPSDLMAMLSGATQVDSSHAPHDHTHEVSDTTELDALVGYMRSAPERRAAWTDVVRRTLQSITDEEVTRMTDVMMEIAVDEIQGVFRQLLAEGIITWGPDADGPGLTAGEGEVVLLVPLRGLVGDELLDRCVEIADDNNVLGRQIYESVVAHRAAHDFAGDPVDESQGEEIELLVSLDDPRAAKYPHKSMVSGKEN